MKQINHDSKIIIIGAGTWGCAIALSLARRGYKNITVFDSHEFPSAIAAGNDLNKIMEEETPAPTDTGKDYFMNRISQMSGLAWRTDPIYSQFYHPTGFIMAAASQKLYEETVIPYAEEHKSEIRMLHSAKDWQAIAPKVFTGEFPNWQGAFRTKGAGWVYARGAIEAACLAATKLGVKFVTGSPTGAVRNLLYSPFKDDIQGVVTQDNISHLADLTILSAGAGSDSLLDFKKQLRPAAWTLAHVPLSKDEAAAYKDLPVPYCVDRGFFIEPNEETHEIKICDEHPGYVNFVRDEKGEILRSEPFARQQIPLESERRIRQLLKDTMPQLADYEFSFARICWDADTVDRVFLIDWHPELPSLVLACGGSGHGVNPMPAIGIVVAALIEGKMEDRLHEMSKWRPEQAVNRDWWDTQGRHGADEKIMELKDVEGWTRIGGKDEADMNSVVKQATDAAFAAKDTIVGALQSMVGSFSGKK